MEIKEFQPKIKFFGVGGRGNNIVHNIKANARLSKILIDTDKCHLDIRSSQTTSLDAAILCGRKTCRGFGCGGNFAKGYQSAKESFSNIMYLFSHNEINLFICGLGGGAGTGITKYLLKELKKVKYNYNKYNIVLCTFPLDIERKRVKKAKSALKVISKYCDLLILIDMEKIIQEYTKKMPIFKKFRHINNLIMNYV